MSRTLYCVPRKIFHPDSVFPGGRHLQRMVGYSPDSASYKKTKNSVLESLHRPDPPGINEWVCL